MSREDDAAPSAYQFLRPANRCERECALGALKSAKRKFGVIETKCAFAGGIVEAKESRVPAAAARALHERRRAVPVSFLYTARRDEFREQSENSLRAGGLQP